VPGKFVVITLPVEGLEMEDSEITLRYSDMAGNFTYTTSFNQTLPSGTTVRKNLTTWGFIRRAVGRFKRIAAKMNA
jgi:hypothetical protein